MATPAPPYISQCAGDVELEVKAKKYWTTNRIQEPGFLYIHQVEIMQPSQKIVSRIAELNKTKQYLLGQSVWFHREELSSLNTFRQVLS